MHRDGNHMNQGKEKDSLCKDRQMFPVPEDAVLNGKQHSNIQQDDA